MQKNHMAFLSVRAMRFPQAQAPADSSLHLLLFPLSAGQPPLLPATSLLILLKVAKLSSKSGLSTTVCWNSKIKMNC